MACSLTHIYAEVELITQPRPGEEYVLVSSGGQQALKNFETSHKIPEKHPQHRVLRHDESEELLPKKTHYGSKNIKHATEGIVSIEESKRVLLKKGHKSKIAESIEVDIPVSKLEHIKIKENIKDVDTNPKMAVALEAMSESGKLVENIGTTTQKPVLTTTAPRSPNDFEFIPVNVGSIDDINSGLLSSNVKLETAGSEQKQHSRIQIKKGPNGQDYEYEYVYYYYDDEEEGAKGKDKVRSTTAASVHNSHDGPQKVESENQITKESKAKNKYSSIDRTGITTLASVAPTVDTQNDVVPARGRQRGRNIVPAPVQEEIIEERSVNN